MDPTLVNLEDPLFVEREIVAKLNGVDAEDFDDMVNFVSVQLRKVHGNGDITDRELKIDRKTFTETGNSFPMEYGWKGDDDDSKGGSMNDDDNNDSKGGSMNDYDHDYDSRHS